VGSSELAGPRRAHRLRYERGRQLSRGAGQLVDHLPVAGEHYRPRRAGLLFGRGVDAEVFLKGAGRGVGGHGRVGRHHAKTFFYRAAPCPIPLPVVSQSPCSLVSRQYPSPGPDSSAVRTVPSVMWNMPG
jgi:hypothetical protein